MPQLVEESDAIKLWNLLPSAPEEQKPQMAAILRRYEDQEKSAGRAPYANYQQGIAERARRVRSLYTDERHGMQEEQLDAFQRSLARVRNPDATKFDIINSEFLAPQYGARPNEIDGRLPHLMQDYAQKRWNLSTPINGGQFFKLVKADYELSQNQHLAALNGAVAGNSTGTSWAEFKAAHGNDAIWNAAKERERAKQFFLTSHELSVKVADLRPVANEVQSILSATDDPEQLRKAIPLTGNLNDFEAGLVMTLLENTAKGSADKDIAHQTGETLYRTVRDVWRGNLQFYDKRSLAEADGKLKPGLSVPSEVADQGPAAVVSYLAMESSKKFDAQLTAGFAGGGEAVDLREDKREYRKLSAEEAEAARAEVKTRHWEVAQINRLQGIADQIVDPVRASNFFTEHYYYPAVRAGGVMVNAMIPGGGGLLANFGFYANAETDRLIGLGVDPGKAALQAGAVASVQAALDRAEGGILLGKFSFTRRFLKTPAPSVKGHAGRFVVNWGFNVGAETIIEIGQDHIAPALIQDLTQQGGDVAWLGPEGVMAKAVAAVPETASAMLLLGLIGATASGVNDFKQARTLLQNEHLLTAYIDNQAKVTEIRTLAEKGNYSEAAAKFREYAAPALKQGVTLSDAGKKALEQYHAKAQQEKASEDHLESVGILPVMRRTADAWQVHYQDGSTMDFGTHEEASEARWQHVADRGFEVHQATRDIFNRMEQNAEAGREFAIEFDSRDMTARLAIDQGLASEGQMQERADVADIFTDSGSRKSRKTAPAARETAIDENADFDNAIAVSNSISRNADDSLAAARILGMSRTERLDGVLRTTMRLFQGATPLTAIEEKLEGDVDIMIRNGQREWLLSALRDVEEKLGDRLFRTKDNAKIKDSDLKEAWSHLGQAYFVGRSRKGDPAMLESWKEKGFRKVFSEIMTSKAGGAMNAYAAFFRAVWRRAARLNKLRKEGGLRGDVEMELSRQFGLEQRQHEAAVVQEARAIVDEAHLKHLEELEDGGAAFSMLPGETSFSVLTRQIEPGSYPESLRSAIASTTVSKLTAHPDYEAAKKNGDGAAAARVVHATLKPAKVEELRALITPDVPIVFVPVVHQDTGRRANMLPMGYAVKLQRELGGEVETEIVKVSGRANTGVSVEQRFANAQAFDGPVRAGVQYVVVDDTFTSGDTLTALIDHISTNGGKVVAATTLAKSQSQNYLKARPEDVAKLLDAARLDEASFAREFGYPITALTGSEIYRLANLDPGRKAGGIEWLRGRLPSRGSEAGQGGSGSRVRPAGEEGQVTFSFSPGELEGRIVKMFDPFQRTPALRQKVSFLAQGRMTRFVRSWEKSSEGNRAISSINREARVREALAVDTHEKQLTADRLTAADVAALEDVDQTRLRNHPLVEALLQGAGRLMSRTRAIETGKLVSDDKNAGDYDGTPYLPPFMYGGSVMPDQAAQFLYEEGLLRDPYPDTLWDALAAASVTTEQVRERHDKARAKVKEIRSLARAEAVNEVEQWRVAAVEAAVSPAAERSRLLAALRTLDAILSAFPPEVRAKVGGYVQLAKLSTDEARIKEIEHRISKMDRLLEEWLQKDITSRLDKLLEKAEPKGGPGEALKGKIGADGHRWFGLVHEAVVMTEEQAFEEMGKMEAIIADPAAEASKQDAALERWTVLHQFGGWEEKTAAEMSAAVEAAESVYKNGREAWKKVLEDRKAVRDALRASAATEAGGVPEWDERQKASGSEMKSGQWQKTKDWFNRHYSFQQVLQTIFGGGSTMRHFERKARAATRQKTDAIIRRIGEFRDAMRSIFGTQSWRDTQRALFELQKRVTDAPVTFYGNATVRRREAPADLVRLIVDGKAQWSDYDFAKGFTQADKDQMERLLDANDMAPARAKKGMLAFETVNTGPALGKGELSQFEAIHFSMLAKQEVYREAMERHGITSDTLSDIEAWLTPEAKAVRAWLFEQYEAGYAPMNEVYSRMFGVALPKVKNYAPGYFETEGKQTEMDPFSSGMEATGMAAPFLKKRKNHRARPVQIDAMQAYWQHIQMTEHWLAWAETVQEMRSVFGNPDLRATMETRRGHALAGDLMWWVDTLEKGGVRDSQANAFLAKVMRANVRIALGYKVSVMLKQLPAMMGSLSDIPAGGWVRSARRVLTGSAPISATEMFKLPTIQRRIDSGYSPEMRVAMRGPTARPSAVEDVLEWGMQRIGWVDAAFSSFSASVAYDYHFNEAVKMGVPEAEAATLAMEMTENTVGRTSQPGEVMDRSRLELEAKGLGKLLFMFQSANRQAFSLVQQSLGDAVFRSGDKGKAARVVFTQFVVVPVMMQTMAGLVRYLFSDDEAEEAWAVEDYAKAIALGPMSGILFLGAVVQAAADGIWGKTYGNRADNPLVEAASTAYRSMEDLAEGDFDSKDAGNLAVSSSLLLSGFVNAPTEAAGVAWNVLKQILGLADSAESIAEGDK